MYNLTIILTNESKTLEVQKHFAFESSRDEDWQAIINEMEFDFDNEEIKSKNLLPF